MKHENIYYVYKITNKINKKVYIGFTKNIKKRLKYHFYSKSSKFSLIRNAIKKYGINNFYVRIIFKGSKLDCCNKEIEKIEQYKKLKISYNIHTGGIGGDTFTDHPNKENIRQNIKNIWNDEKTREKHKKNLAKSSKSISNSLKIYHARNRELGIKKIKSGEENPLYGRKMAQKTKIQISQSMKQLMQDKNNKDKMLKIQQLAAKKRTIILTDKQICYLTIYFINNLTIAEINRKTGISVCIINRYIKNILHLKR